VICVSIFENTVSNLLDGLKIVNFAEIRLDNLNPTKAEFKKIFSNDKILIATMRPGKVSDDRRAAFLLSAIKAGAKYVDIEIESRQFLFKDVIKEARDHNCKVIVSYHNHQETPKIEHLEAIVGDCFKMGADIAKVACLAKNKDDCLALLGLLAKNKNVIPIGMGKAGRITRVAGPLLGAPFTFASLEEGKETAVGQLSFNSLKRLIEEIEE